MKHSRSASIWKSRGADLKRHVTSVTPSATGTTVSARRHCRGLIQRLNIGLGRRLAAGPEEERHAQRLIVAAGRGNEPLHWIFSKTTLCQTVLAAINVANLIAIERLVHSERRRAIRRHAQEDCEVVTLMPAN